MLTCIRFVGAYRCHYWLNPVTNEKKLEIRASLTIDELNLMNLAGQRLKSLNPSACKIDIPCLIREFKRSAKNDLTALIYRISVGYY